MTIQAHADAILDRLRADVGLTVHDGKVPPGAAAPYVLVYFDDADPGDPADDAEDLTAVSRRHVARAICHCVGADQIAARAVAQRVRAQLLDHVPTVAGRTCWPIRREDGQPTDRDETTGTLVQDLVAVYRLESVPAA